MTNGDLIGLIAGIALPTVSAALLVAFRMGALVAVVKEQGRTLDEIAGRVHRQGNRIQRVLLSLTGIKARLGVRLEEGEGDFVEKTPAPVVQPRR